MYSRLCSLTILLMFDNRIERYFNYTTLATRITWDFNYKFLIVSPIALSAKSLSLLLGLPLIAVSLRTRRDIYLVRPRRFELRTPWLKVMCSTIWATVAYILLQQLLLNPAVYHSLDQGSLQQRRMTFSNHILTSLLLDLAIQRYSFSLQGIYFPTYNN